MMKQRVMLIILLGFGWLVPVQAQQTENLEIIWCRHGHRGHQTTIGRALQECGDINADGYDDFLVMDASHSDTIVNRVYVFHGGNPPDTLPDLTIFGTKFSDWFGTSLASGLLNTDAYPDLVVGAAGIRQVNIYFGGPGMDTLTDLVLLPMGGYAFGDAVTTSDVNGDGWDDIVVGDYWFPDGAGKVSIYYGGPLLNSQVDIQLRGRWPETFGHAVGGGGDLNGDGYQDIAVGAPQNNDLYPNGGKVYVFFGGNPMDTIPDLWHYGENPGAWLGWRNRVAVTRISLNDDRYADGWWGTPEDPNPWQGTGYVLFGGNPMDPDPDLMWHGKTDTSDLCYSVAEGGRVTGGQYSSIIAGAVSEVGPGGFSGGAAYLYLGGAAMDTIPDGVIYGRGGYDAMGAVVAGAGDVNNDGRDEIMVSNYFCRMPPGVWVCRYTGVEVEEKKGDARLSMLDAGLRILQNPTRKAQGVRLLVIGDRPEAELKVYDVAGKLVQSFTPCPSLIASGPITLHLNPGVYFVRLETEAAMVTKKVVVVE